MRPTAPSPIFGMKDKFARDWIPMPVVQFLLQFLLAPHIEVIEAALPESRSVRLRWSKAQSELHCRRFSRALSQSPGDSLLEHLQDFRGITPLGFTKEQMNMLRHDYIPDELDVMPRADLVQNFHKMVTSPRRAEQRTTTIATEGNEMNIAAPIETLQTVAHKQAANCKAKSKTAPLKSTRMRHPRLHLLSTRVSTRMIYSANVFGTMKTAKESMGHPPQRHLPRQLGSA